MRTGVAAFAGDGNRSRTSVYVIFVRNSVVSVCGKQFAAILYSDPWLLFCSIIGEGRGGKRNGSFCKVSGGNREVL